MKDKIIVITGAARGLGKALAKELLSKGTLVIISDIDEDQLQNTAQELGIEGIKADTTQEEETQELSKKVTEKYGKIDIWINNAGIWTPKIPLEEMDLPRIKKLYEVNVLGTINGMRTAITLMKKQKQGTIVNVISTTAFDGMAGSSGSIYVSTKYALRGLTNSIREEVIVNNINVIGVYPGGMKTDLFNEKIPDTIGDFMSAESVAEKIVANLEKEKPDQELVLKRPTQV